MSGKRTSSRWREHLTSPLTWHWAGVAVLLLLTIGLAIRLGMDWTAMDRDSGNVLTGKQLQLKALEIQTAPLRGLDRRVDKTRVELLDFYKKRIPPDYSTISGRIGDLAVASNVRLSRVQYSQGPPGSDLTEISMDAGISGPYPGIMHFINSLERDKNFFVIRTMALTSQQGGLVNLRLRVSTWLRPENVPSGLPSTPPADQPDGKSSTPIQEGE
jgi:hypothetical protein